MSYLAICPTGTVFPFAGTTAPNGWLLCDGSAVSRTIYSRLFSVLSSSCGSGDGSTTFNIPDYRGVFMRGVDGGTARDPDSASRVAMNSGGNSGASVNSIQGMASARAQAGSGSNPYTNPNASKSTAGLTNSNSSLSGAGTDVQGNHSHSITRPNMWGNGTAGNTWGSGWNNDNVNLGNVAHGSDTQGAHSHNVSGTALAQTISGDNETRPKNAYVNYIIKV